MRILIAKIIWVIWAGSVVMIFVRGEGALEPLKIWYRELTGQPVRCTQLQYVTIFNPPECKNFGRHGYENLKD